MFLLAPAFFFFFFKAVFISVLIQKMTHALSCVVEKNKTKKNPKNFTNKVCVCVCVSI